MTQEIFRYYHDGLEYIGSIDPFDEFKKPKGYEDIDSLWICVGISNKSCKKNIGPINRDTFGLDNRYTSGNVKDGLNIYYDMLSLLRKWVDSKKPPFLTISPYSDDNERKRGRIYDRAMRKMGYEIYDVNYDYEQIVLTYIRKDLGIKNKRYDFDNVFDNYLYSVSHRYHGM